MTELTDQIEAVLTIDKMLLRTIYGIPSKPLTRFIEKVCTDMYKEREPGQGIWFIIGNWINFLLQIKVISGSAFPGWVNGLYNYAWFVGFGISGFVYWLASPNPSKEGLKNPKTLTSL